MGKFTTFWLACTIFTATLTSAAYYNTARVVLYTRLSQQLRYQISQSLHTTVARMGGLQQKLNAASAAMNVVNRNVKRHMYRYERSLDPLLLKSNTYPTIALKVRVSDRYPWSVNNIFWNTVERSYGFSYDVSTGDAPIERTGWYMMEMTTLQTPITYLKMRILIRKPNNRTRYNFYHWFRNKGTPIFQALKLYRGDRLDTLTMRQSGNRLWRYQRLPITVVGGLSNQLTLRYLGKIPPRRRRG